MQVVDGRLVEGAKTRITSDRALDAHEAIPLLLAGAVVYVQLFGLNYVSVRTTLWKKGVEVSE